MAHARTAHCFSPANIRTTVKSEKAIPPPSVRYLSSLDTPAAADVYDPGGTLIARRSQIAPGKVASPVLIAVRPSYDDDRLLVGTS